MDCHRNDISHDMTRGYAGEAEDYGDEKRAEFSCRGCHMDENLSRRGSDTAGRLGAPYPAHSGVPALHFERLSCTACHSGPLVSKESIRVKTSRANRLGIYGVAQWSTDWPDIVEPVFVKDRSGKIVPHRLMWPSFWGRDQGRAITPIRPEEVAEAAGDILLVEENAAEALKAISLYGEIPGIPVLVLSGNVYELNADGLLDVSAYSGEEVGAEIYWAVKAEEGIIPLIPEFDPDAELPDADAETRIQNVLIAMGTIESAPGKPGIVFKKALYHMPEGYLEKTEWAGERAVNAELVWINGEENLPVVSGFQARSIAATVGFDKTLTEEQVALVLGVLSGSNEGDSFVYISGGRVFRLDDGGSLVDDGHPAAEPVTWPLGHTVRPAQQSLGVNGCKDCHSESSAFFFARIAGNGPLKTERVAIRSAHTFMSLDKPYQKLFGLSFRVRPLLKGVLFAVAVVVGAMLLIMAMVILGRYTGLIERRK